MISNISHSFQHLLNLSCFVEPDDLNSVLYHAIELKLKICYHALIYSDFQTRFLSR